MEILDKVVKKEKIGESWGVEKWEEIVLGDIEKDEENDIEGKGFRK